MDATSRPVMAGFRITAAEKADLEALAARRSAGNVAELLRSHVLPWVRGELAAELAEPAFPSDHAAA